MTNNRWSAFSREDLVGALDAAEERFNALANAIPDLILILDADGRYMEAVASPEHESLLLRTPNELRGKRLHDLLPREQADEFLEVARRTIATGQRQVHEYALEVMAGKLWFEGRTAPFKDADGATRVLWVAHDITTRHSQQEQRQQLALQRRQLAQTLLDTLEDERKRIARDLHDDLGQLLTALKIGCRQVLERLPPEAEVTASATRMAELLGTAMESVQKLVRGLRPVVVDYLGLVPAIDTLLEDMTTSTLRASLEANVETDSLSPDVRMAVYRIVQEAVTNVARHASATRVRVSIQSDETELRIVVRDDGHGIPPEALTAATSLGITSMRERAAIIGAVLEIVPNPDNGTTVSLQLPTTPG